MGPYTIRTLCYNQCYDLESFQFMCFYWPKGPFDDSDIDFNDNYWMLLFSLSSMSYDSRFMAVHFISKLFIQLC